MRTAACSPRRPGVPAVPALAAHGRPSSSRAGGRQLDADAEQRRHHAGEGAAWPGCAPAADVLSPRLELCRRQHARQRHAGRVAPAARGAGSRPGSSAGSRCIAGAERASWRRGARWRRPAASPSGWPSSWARRTRRRRSSLLPTLSDGRSPRARPARRPLRAAPSLPARPAQAGCHRGPGPTVARLSWSGGCPCHRPGATVLRGQCQARHLLIAWICYLRRLRVAGRHPRADRGRSRAQARTASTFACRRRWRPKRASAADELGVVVEALGFRPVGEAGVASPVTGRRGRDGAGSASSRAAAIGRPCRLAVRGPGPAQGGALSAAGRPPARTNGSGTRASSAAGSLPTQLVAAGGCG